MYTLTHVSCMCPSLGHSRGAPCGREGSAGTWYGNMRMETLEWKCGNGNMRVQEWGDQNENMSNGDVNARMRM